MKVNLDEIFDIDLPPVRRTESNYYQALYFAALVELRNANKGIKRLHTKCKKLEERLKTNESTEIRRVPRFVPPPAPKAEIAT